MLMPLLRDVRIIYHINPERLIEGILHTVNKLKKYESGEKQPEKLFGDVLWQRTGKSIEKFQVFLEQDEYGLAHDRADIQKFMRQGELAKVEESLQAYEEAKGTDRPQHRQFICLQRAEFYRRKGESYEKQMSVVQEGLAYTIHSPLLPEIMGTHRFGMLELLLLERYAFLLEQKSPEEAVHWYQELRRYLTPAGEDGMDYDHADQYWLLPPVLYHYAVWAVKVEFYEQALALLTEGCRMLGERQAFLALFVKMEELKLWVLSKLGREVPAWEAECLRLLQEVMEKSNPAWKQNIYPDYPERSLYCVNAALRERRLAHGKTIKDMAGGFDIRTLKAIESGKQMPQSATKNALFQELGLSTCKYGSSLVTRRYSDFRDSAKMINCNYRGEYEQAEQIYGKLASGVDKKEKINEQFISYWDISLRYSGKKITKEQYRKELWGLLKETLPKCEEIGVDCVLTEYEREVLEVLAWAVDVEDEDATYIEEMLEIQYRKFREDDALVCFFPEYYAALARCLSRIARLKQEYEKAESILNDVLGQFYFLENDFRLGSLFIQRFQLHEDVRKAQGLLPAQDDNEYFQDIRYAYAINKLYLRDDVSVKFIEGYLSRYYSNKDRILWELL